MTSERSQDLPPAQRRRAIVWAVLRSLLIAAVLVVLYYVLPLDRPWDSDTAVRLLIGLVVVAGVVVWGVKIITGSRYPGLRAVEALALVLPFFLLLFASTYFVMERNSAASFTEPMTRTDALYFTVTVFSTVGFLLDGGLRGHHPQIRDCPGRAHGADARRSRASWHRHTGDPGGRATQPGATIADGR